MQTSQNVHLTRSCANQDTFRKIRSSSHPNPRMVKILNVILIFVQLGMETNWNFSNGYLTQKYFDTVISVSRIVHEVTVA